MARIAMEGGSNAGAPNAGKSAKEIAADAAYRTAVNAAQKNPTQVNKNAVKDAYTAKVAAQSPAIDYAQVIKEAQTISANIDKTVADISQQVIDVNVAGEAAGNISKAMGGPGWTPVDLPPSQNKSKENQDAYALLESIFRSYGLESLVPVIRGYMEQDLGVEQAKLRLKTEQAYKDRFKGNEIRLAKGLNVIDEASYLELENDYSETLRAYGVSDYFGIAVDSTSRLARQQKMAEVIGNDISATEFKSRVSTAVSRVQNADTNTKDAFKALYGINDTDLVKYFLDPTQGSEQLKTKATAAEISGAAVSAGLSGTSLGTAEELAKLGVDKSTALEGYAAISGFLPRTEFLGQIYDETGIQYNRASAEAETFKGLASEKRKREQLKALEEAQFGGASGTLRTGRTTGNQGAF
jgi:hypothetical protein